MKICTITVYMVVLVDEDGEELKYTAVMEPGGYIGHGYCPQEALDNLPEDITNHILKNPDSITPGDKEAAHHWLCEPGQTLESWVEETKIMKNWFHK